VKDVIATAERRRQQSGRRTVLFVDEIHRFSKLNRMLPSHVEAGTLYWSVRRRRIRRSK
jgi:replication-associated recombination protein RarA